MGFKEELKEYIRQFKESGETLYRWRKGYGHPFELDLLDVEELIAFLAAVETAIEQGHDSGAGFLIRFEDKKRIKQALFILTGEEEQ